jgi:hypothetical protein
MEFKAEFALLVRSSVKLTFPVGLFTLAGLEQAPKHPAAITASKAPPPMPNFNKKSFLFIDTSMSMILLRL